MSFFDFVYRFNRNFNFLFRRGKTGKKIKFVPVEKKVEEPSSHEENLSDKLKDFKVEAPEGFDVLKDKVAARDKYIRELAITCSAKVGSAMTNHYMSTRVPVDMIALEGSLDGVYEAILDNSPFIEKITVKTVSNKKYLVMHICHDSEGHYLTRNQLNK